MVPRKGSATAPFLVWIAEGQERPLLSMKSSPGSGLDEFLMGASGGAGTFHRLVIERLNVLLSLAGLNAPKRDMAGWDATGNAQRVSLAKMRVVL